MKTLEQLVEIATQNNRICPKPTPWLRLCAVIGKDKPNDELTPLILGAWDSEDEDKQARLIKQIHYAYTQSDQIRDRFIKVLESIDEDGWHHSKTNK